MKITLIQNGKTQDPHLQALADDYSGRLNHYCNFKVITLPPVKAAHDKGVSEVLKAESKAYLNCLKDGYDKIVLLDDKGKQFSSEELAGWVEKLQNQSYKSIALVTGGAYGFAPEVYELAHEKISLSRLTFSHQMVRVILCEQIYRAYTIIKGEKYHHG